MTRHLLAAPVTFLLVAALAVPAEAEEDAPPGLVEHLDRIGHLPADLIKARKTNAEITDALYLAALARLPTDAQKERAAKHFAAAENREEAARDLAWALVNTKDFLKLHGMDKEIAASLALLNRLAEKWGKEKQEKK